MLRARTTFSHCRLRDGSGREPAGCQGSGAALAVPCGGCLHLHAAPTTFSPSPRGSQHRISTVAWGQPRWPPLVVTMPALALFSCLICPPAQHWPQPPLRAHPPTRHRPVMMPGSASLPCQAINPADLHAKRPRKSKASAKGGELEQRGGARSSPARRAGRGPGQAGDVCCTARVWSCWGIICGHCWHPESPLIQILVPRAGYVGLAMHSSQHGEVPRLKGCGQGASFLVIFGK